MVKSTALMAEAEFLVKHFLWTRTGTTLVRKTQRSLGTVWSIWVIRAPERSVYTQMKSSLSRPESGGPDNNRFHNKEDEMPKNINTKKHS